MKKYGKWLSGALGWAVMGPIGGLLGFGLVSILEKLSENEEDRGNTNDGTRNSFLLSLVVLSAAVMKGDGKIMKSELNFVKDFIRKNFGDQAVVEAVAILKEVLSKEINIDSVSAQIASNMPLSHRLQLLHYLCGVAQADFSIAKKEIEILRKIASALNIPIHDSDSIFAMYGINLSSNVIGDAYVVLGIDERATDDEVKRAYRSMAVKHHPDKVANLGEDVRKAAEEKFKSISDAYDKIKVARGIK